TPDPLSLHRELAWLTEEGITHGALEASSHGLDQCRLDGVKLTAAAFTQLSQDHLDYHQTMSTYFMAKQRLFADLLPSSGISVLNADIPEYPVLRQIAEQREQQVLDYGKHARSLVWEAWEPTPHGQHLRGLLLGQPVSWFVPLIGDFQSANLLCAIGLVLASGTRLEELFQIFPPSTTLPLQGVPGRLEHLEGARKRVLVDYAHSPHALEKALAAIRPHTEGRILLVFGCGGNRDATKRPLMGRIAEQKSDFLFLTDDNPREEDPDSIRKEIRAGLTARIPFQEIPDRREAIAAALAEATSEDCVLIAGKGHEVTQQRGKERYPFNDREVVREILHL
ncbi:MAG: UDP-N-acetylmuramoyl-L-alanyl-D-glutamate--2,6-diaminopimelate ligase, partial [Holosporales bacterium]|nr:UDP-N-acetylmuramoyl-L-alanyl-D-glutamate--2,6-diaminopimelate ligase [Holosporales bacterium]